MNALAEIDGVRLMTSLAFEGYGAAIVPASAIPGWLRGDFVWAQRHRPRPNRATLAVRDTLVDIVDRYADRQPGVTKDILPLPARTSAKGRPSIGTV
jgi:LysR family hydrogen peroxide-inducible transcriptional activator